jgi:hypothetical protein
MVGNTAILQIEVQCSPSDARERVDNYYKCSEYMHISLASEWQNVTKQRFY